MRAKMMVQVLLRSPNKDGEGYAVRVCWVDNARVLRKGSKITLANSENRRRKWEVMWMSDAMDAALIHADWNVGGLQGER